VRGPDKSYSGTSLHLHLCPGSLAGRSPWRSLSHEPGGNTLANIAVTQQLTRHHLNCVHLKISEAPFYFLKSLFLPSFFPFFLPPLFFFSLSFLPPSLSLPSFLFLSLSLPLSLPSCLLPSLPSFLFWNLPLSLSSLLVAFSSSSFKKQFQLAGVIENIEIILRKSYMSSMPQ